MALNCLIPSHMKAANSLQGARVSQGAKETENECLLQPLGRVEGIVLPLQHFQRRPPGYLTKLSQIEMGSRFLVVVNKELD